jgi:hypothetical protein
MRSRELGDGVRLAMTRAGLNGKRTAALLHWSESRVSRLLTGQLSVPEADIAALLDLCAVDGAERDRLLGLNRDPYTPGWLQQHGSTLPEQLRTLIDHESQAVGITDFEPIRVPGLLQTGDYARALLERSPTIAVGDIQDRVAARLARRSLFSRPDRPAFTFYLHEFALRLPVGGRGVMSEQLHELLRMGVRTNVAIRVVPVAFGAHAGTSGACRLMEFAEFKPVGYVETQTAGHFIEEPDEIADYQRTFAALADCALDEGLSRDLIATLALELYGEDHDDRT